MRPFTVNSTLRDLMTTRLGRAAVFLAKGALRRQLAKSGMGGADVKTASDADRLLDAMVYDMPLRAMTMSAGGKLGVRHAQAVADVFNGRQLRAVRDLLNRP